MVIVPLDDGLKMAGWLLTTEAIHLGYTCWLRDNIQAEAMLWLLLVLPVCYHSINISWGMASYQEYCTGSKLTVSE